MNELAAVAVHNAVAALLLAVVVWIVTRIVRRPAVAHVLWLLVLLRLIAPPVFGWNFGGLVGSDGAVALAVHQEADMHSATSGTAANPLVSPWMNRHRGHDDAIPAATVAQVSEGIEASESRWPSLAVLISWLPVLSLAVTALAAIFAGVRVLRFRRLLSHLDLAPDPVQRMVQETAQKLRVVPAPVVRIGPATGSPYVWSVGLRPVVVVPAQVLAALNTEQLAMVLAHELAHLRRRDHWVRWIELGVVLACWWNPLVYWTRRKLHEAEELCCDAWVASLFPDCGRTYADALLQATELSHNTLRPMPLLFSPLFRVHPLKTRIAMIVQGRTSHRNSRWAALLLAAIAFILLPSYVTLTAADDDAAAPVVTEASAAAESTPVEASKDEPAASPLTYNPDDPGWLQVSVYTQHPAPEGRVVHTEPVEGATIGVFLGLFDDYGNGISASARTGGNGTCSIPVPYGQLQTSPPVLPAGYWLDFSGDDQEPSRNISITPKMPVYETTFFAIRGPIWNIRARDAKTGEPVGLLQCDVSPEKNSHLQRSGPTVLDAAGVGQFTPPGVQGKFRGRLFGPALELKTHEPPRFTGQFELTLHENFEPSHVVEIRAGETAKSARLMDRNGRIAEVTGATAAIENGTLYIDAVVEPFELSSEAGRGTGTVVNPNGQPVKGARVTTMVHTAEGERATYGLPTLTDADGRFEFKHLMLGSTSGLENTQVLVIAAASGFAHVYSAPIAHPQAAGDTVDFGRIVLPPAHSVRVQVLNPLGDPAAGAVVGSVHDHRPTKRYVTAENGEVLLGDLPAGKVHLMASCDGEHGGAEIVVPDDGQVVTATLRLQPQFGVEPKQGGPAQRPKKAPALQIAAWSDGNTRTIEALRGRVVVLYFWDLKQEGCDQELAVIDNLRQRFAEDGVVFLGVHRAGSTMDEVRAWMQEKDWRLPTGLDQANDAGQSLTMEAYGVGAASFVVVLANGNMFFNRDQLFDDEDGERLYMQAAHALNIPWPIEETDTDAEGCEVCLQLIEYIERRMIERALGR